MGLKDLLKKALTGASDEENQANRAKMRTIFNQKVPQGQDYTIIYCHSQNYTDAVVVKVTRHSNFIVGYKSSNEPCVAVIPVDPSLTQADDAILFTKATGGVTKTSMGYCLVGNETVGFQLEPITYTPAVNRGSSYHLAVVQTQAEVSAFKAFCKAGL